MIDYFYVKYNYDIVKFVYADMCKKSEATSRHIDPLCEHDLDCIQKYFIGCTCNKQFLCDCPPPPNSTNIANNLLAPELRT